MLFPGRRLVALYGHPGARSLGVLGEQGVAAAIRRAERVARPYRALSTVPVVPSFEMIATVAQRSAGSDGDYSAESSVQSLRPWVEAAGRHGMLVAARPAARPGRPAGPGGPLRRAAPAAVRRSRRGPGVEAAAGTSGRCSQIGSIDAAEINRTSAWLAALVRADGLPQKLFVVHQFRLSMIGHEERLRTDHPELALLVHMDGQGGAAQKLATWRSVRARPAGRVAPGLEELLRRGPPDVLAREDDGPAARSR